jgi:hypothetical protein
MHDHYSGIKCGLLESFSKTAQSKQSPNGRHLLKVHFLDIPVNQERLCLPTEKATSKHDNYVYMFKKMVARAWERTRDLLIYI